MHFPGARIRRVIPGLLGVAAALAAASSARAQKQDPIVQVLDRDAITAIHNPRFVRAEKASLHPEEKVLGVVVGGQARAYPLIDLDRHEVVDDIVGGTPIAATW